MNLNKRLFSTLLFILFSLSFYAQKTNDASGSDYLKYYTDSYKSARESFKIQAQMAKRNHPDSKCIQLHVPSKQDNDLTVNLAFFPATKKSDKIFILSSGVHGVEGYVGNAIQSMFIEKFLNDKLLKESSVLLIHSVNPYGFKYQRRVTENNVDLNRNSTNDKSLYSTVNVGYPQVYDLINPKGPVNTRSFGNTFFFFKAIFKILKASMPVLRQAVLQGQYEYPEGLYFGGKTFEPQIESLTRVIDSISEPYNKIFAVDLHTGYGEKGTLHLFPNPVEDDTKMKMENIFEGYHIDWGDSDDFYTVTGDFVNFIGLLNKGKDFIPMTFEYGTMDSQKTRGSIKSIKIMILENQGEQHGYKRERDSIKVKKDLVEMYYPSSDKWRIKIMKDTETLFKDIITRYMETE